MSMVRTNELKWSRSISSGDLVLMQKWVDERATPTLLDWTQLSLEEFREKFTPREEWRPVGYEI